MFNIFFYAQKCCNTTWSQFLFRSGTNHAFKSSDAQITVGGRIQDKFLWNVKMKNYDIEVNLGFLLLFCFNFRFQKLL